MGKHQHPKSTIAASLKAYYLRFLEEIKQYLPNSMMANIMIMAINSEHSITLVEKTIDEFMQIKEDIEAKNIDNICLKHQRIGSLAKDVLLYADNLPEQQRQALHDEMWKKINNILKFYTAYTTAPDA